MAAANEFYLAPLRGITDSIFRTACERHFGRFDRMVAPFVPTVLGTRVKACHIRDLLPNDDAASRDNGNARLIPQIIGRDPAGFLLLARKFAAMGFTSVNWNLGCPAPLVAKKARGCGLLPHREIIERFLNDVVPELPLPLSIKARLGYKSPDELEALIPLFNAYPLRELIIHPRTGAQLYGGAVDLDRFELCLNLSKHPLVYNGDIVSVSTFQRLADRFPGVSSWMLGRGILMNPFLLGELRSLTSLPSTSPRELAPRSLHETEGALSEVKMTARRISQIAGFLNDLLDACKGHPYPLKVLGRMKELWGYLGKGVGEWEERALRVVRCASLEEYRAVLDGFFKGYG
jgi:tRNA-dihydrouridine synthase